MDYLLIVVGFVLLIKGADLLVDGASAVAKKFGVSNLIIGLTIVAFGTSAPELVVNLISGFEGKGDLALSNVVGSNISNILLILGVTAIVATLPIAKSLMKVELPLALGAVGLLYILVLDGVLSFSDSVIMSIVFFGFVGYTFWNAKKGSSSEEQNEEENISEMPTWKSLLLILLGLVGLVGGGKLIVDSAVSIATNFGVPNEFIGITIVAVGTSLPELAASVVAALKKKTDIAVGGVIGSNIFNTLWILGATGLLVDLEGYENLGFDILVNIGVTALLIGFAFLPKFFTIGRVKGIIFVLLYFSYIGYLVYNVATKSSLS